MRKGLGDLAVLSLALALFSFLSLYQIDLPGLYYDEAADAVPAMQLLLGQKLELVNDAGIWLGGHAFPIMVMDYVGAVNTYALLPFFGLLGVNVLALRLMPIVGGGITIILGYLLAKGLFNRLIAATSVLLLAVHPSFVFWTRQGIYISSLMSLIAVGSLLCLLKWHRGGRRGYLYFASFLLGLGLSAKLLFLWFILALGALYLLLRPRGLSFPSKPWAQLGLSGGAFLTGAWMILLYNIQTQGTLAVLSRNLFTSQYGVNNIAFFQNLLTRIDDFRALLDGGHFWFLGGLFFARLYPFLFWASVVLIAICLLLKSKLRRHWRGLTLFPLLIALILIESCFTISGLWPTHLFILLPFILIVIAVGAYLPFHYLRGGRVSFILGLGVAAALFGQSLYVDMQYHNALAATGGRSTHSDAIYRLASYLDGLGIAKPLAMDWGIKTSIQILSKGRINPVEVFGYTAEPGNLFFDLVYKELNQPKQVYLFHAEDCTVYPRYQAFESLAAKLGKKVTLEKVISERDGSPVYLVYSAS